MIWLSIQHLIVGARPRGPQAARLTRRRGTVRRGGGMGEIEANTEQRRYWSDVAGPRWVAYQAALDEQLAPYGERVLARAALEPGARVLEVGCGCGGLALQLARRVRPGGSVTGVDVSAPMLARARAAAAGLDDVSFLDA